VYELNKYKNVDVDSLAKIYEVHRSTIFRWIAQVKKAKKLRRYQYLEPRSKVPKITPRVKKRTQKLKSQVIEIRQKYRCGKDKISKYLEIDNGVDVSATTVHRVLITLQEWEDPLKIPKPYNRRKKKREKKLRIKDVFNQLKYRVFERFQVDTKYCVINSRTYYIITAIDTITRMAFARAYTRHTSRCAKDFLKRLNYLFELENTEAFVQRDNGSEFMDEFEQQVKRYKIKLITNYARRPQMNGYVERFNRTLNDELLEWEEASSVKEVNGLLREFLITYNFIRIHTNLDYRSPFEEYVRLTLGDIDDIMLRKEQDLSHMLWTSTKVAS